MKRQQSVESLPANQQDTVMSAVDRAVEEYQSVLVEGHLLHVCEMHGVWEVWVNCEDAAFTGVCVSEGITRDLAVAKAVRVLEAVVAELQKPEP